MRIYSLDLLKIMAIFGVVCSHVSLYFVHRVPHDFGVLFLRQLGQCGVVLFYMTSGFFLLNHRHQDPFSYAMGKAKSVAMALAFWLLFYAFYDCVFLFHWIGVPNYTFGQFFNIDRNLSEATHLWFLFSIIGLYFLFPALRPLFVESNSKTILKVTCALLLLANLTLLEKGLTSVFGMPEVIHPSLLMSSQVYGLVSFLLGGYFGLVYQPKTLPRIQYWGGGLVALVSFCLLTWLTQHWEITYFYGKFYNLPLQMTAVIVFYLILHTRVEGMKGFISSIGSKTLGIYLVHNIFVLEIDGSRLYDKLYPMFSFLSVYGYILVYSVIAFMLSYWLCCLLSKNRWLHRLISL